MASLFSFRPYGTIEPSCPVAHMRQIKDLIQEAAKIWRSLPFLLRFAALFFSMGSLFTPVSILVAGFGAFSIGEFIVEGKRVTGPQFLRESWIILFVGLVSGVGMSAVAYGFWTRQRWVREVVIGGVGLLFLTWAIGTILDGYSSYVNLVGEMICWVVLVLFFVWYLYFKQNVRNYFETPEAEHHALK